MRSFKTHSLLTIFPERPGTCLMRHDQLVRIFRVRPTEDPWVRVDLPILSGLVAARSGHARRQKAEVNVSAREPLRLLEAAYRKFKKHLVINGIRPLFPTPSGISRPSGYSGYTGHPWTVSVEGWKLLPQPNHAIPKTLSMDIWLVVWNMFFFFSYIGNNHPNWRNHILQRGRLKPPTRYKCDLRKKTLETLQPSSVQRPRGKSWGCSISAHARRSHEIIGSQNWRRKQMNLDLTWFNDSCCFFFKPYKLVHFFT